MSALIPIALMAGGTAMQVSAALTQGKIAEAQAKGEAATLEANAMAEKAEAAEKARYYGEQVLKAKREGKAVGSRAQAALAAGGVSVTSGSSAKVLAEIASDTADQVYELQRAGSMAYSTGLWKADWMKKMAMYRRKTGKLERKGYTMSAIGAGLKGGYEIYNEWPGRGTTLTS